MQLEELKLITASNLINLRTGAGLTQAELGAMLNYSDKTISKWERAEAIPDAFVLKQIGDIFGVTVDNLLTSHDEWKPIPTEEPETEQVLYSTDRIIAISIIGVWTLALTAFVALWLANIIMWQVFVMALPVSILVYMILICAFHRRRHLQYVIAAFVLSLFVAGYLLSYPKYNPWQVFLIAIPAEVIVFLSCNLRMPKKALKIRGSTIRREKKNNG
ncbi:MAG: helix-turn-helix domain-containing protein [Oscillospiraceae bacterium]|nr:helix-turn-helix domain-containing protein [Oscillospiraceae bacterium]